MQFVADDERELCTAVSILLCSRDILRLMLRAKISEFGRQIVTFTDKHCVKHNRWPTTSEVEEYITRVNRHNRIEQWLFELPVTNEYFEDGRVK